MKQALLLPLLLLLLALAPAEAQQPAGQYQTIHHTAAGADTVIMAKQLVPDSMPKFPGGDQALFMFLGKTIRYPAAAYRAGKQGVVLLSFIVQADGVIKDIKVVASQGKALDKESIRVVKLMPPWLPALSNGEPVATSFVLPVRYVIAQSPSSPLPGL